MLYNKIGDVMYTELLLGISILPSVILGFYIYKNDKIEKEPKSLLIKLFLSGIVSVILTIILTSIFTRIFPILNYENSTNLLTLFVAVFVGIAFIEEVSKYIMLKMISWKSNDFRYIYDGIVYAVFVSLGFATIENILYVLNGGISVGIMRAILSVPAHAFFGIIMGLYYGMAKKATFLNNNKEETKNKKLAILIPTILHGIFDYCLFAEIGILVFFYLVFVICLYINSFRIVKKMSLNNDYFVEQNNTNLNSDNSIINVSLKNENNRCDKCGYIANGNYCENCGTKIK